MIREINHIFPRFPLETEKFKCTLTISQTIETLADNKPQIEGNFNLLTLKYIIYCGEISFSIHYYVFFNPWKTGTTKVHKNEIN